MVWDNRCLMHRATPYDMTEPRRMWHTRIAGERQSELARTRRLPLATLAIPAALYAVAVLVRAVAVAQISFPLTEGSAYYVAVARNLVEGRGLVIDVAMVGLAVLSGKLAL